MSTRSFLICFGLVVGLLVALSVLQRKEPGTERGARESRRITNLPVREAERMELTGPKGTFIFRKKASQFLLRFLCFEVTGSKRIIFLILRLIIVKLIFTILHIKCTIFDLFFSILFLNNYRSLV